MKTEETMKKLMRVSKIIINHKNSDDRRFGPKPDDKHQGPRPDDRCFGPRPNDRHQGPHPDDRGFNPRPDDRHQGPHPDDRFFGPKEKQILIELLNYDQIDQILFSKEINIIPPESLPIFRKLDERNLISHKHEMENNKIFIFLTPEGIKEANILKEEMKKNSDEFFKCLNEEQLKEFDDILHILIVNN